MIRKSLILILLLVPHFGRSEQNLLLNEEMYASEEKLEQRDFENYRVVISSNPNTFEQFLTIYHDQEDIVYREMSDSGEHYYFGDGMSIKNGEAIDLFSGSDITGNGVPDLVISKWTGGNHCCVQLYIFELGDQFKRIAKIDPFAMDIALVDMDHDGIAEIKLYEESIMELFSCAAESRAGRVVLRLKDGEYQLAPDLMLKNKPNQNYIDKMKKHIEKSFQTRNSLDLTGEFLEIMMKLSYSGNINLALLIAEETWVDSKEGLEDFKREFLEAMKRSQYWVELYQAM